MDIESKTSIYEEKEETQEVNPEEQKSEIKSEKEKDRVLQTAVIVAVVILVIGGLRWRAGSVIHRRIQRRAQRS